MKHYSKLKLQKPKQSEPKVSESMKKAFSTTANLMLNEGKFQLWTKSKSYGIIISCFHRRLIQIEQPERAQTLNAEAGGDG